jgi:hypothetical protein
VDVHISWLRQKLPVAARVRITTLRGVGYRLDELSRLPSATPLAEEAPANGAAGPVAGSLPGEEEAPANAGHAAADGALPAEDMTHPAEELEAPPRSAGSPVALP